MLFLILCGIGLIFVAILGWAVGGQLTHGDYWIGRRR